MKISFLAPQAQGSKSAFASAARKKLAEGELRSMLEGKLLIPVSYHALKFSGPEPQKGAEQSALARLAQSVPEARNTGVPSTCGFRVMGWKAGVPNTRGFRVLGWKAR